jgi:hypothetical protein
VSPLLQESQPDLAAELTVLLQKRNERELVEQTHTFGLLTGAAAAMISVRPSIQPPSRRGLTEVTTKPSF